MKLFLILILSLNFTSCGKKKNEIIKTPPIVGFDAITSSELNSYLSTFNTRMITAGVNDIFPGVSFSMTSDDICTNESFRFNGKCNDGVLGICTKFYSGSTVVNRRITIDAHYWKTLPKASKEELMFHELAHCLRNRGHVATSTGGVADSMMNPYHLGPTVYTGNYAKYLNELFDPAPGTTSVVFNGVSFNGGSYASTVASNLSVEEFQMNQDDLLIQQTHCIEENIHLE